MDKIYRHCFSTSL